MRRKVTEADFDSLHNLEDHIISLPCGTAVHNLAVVDLILPARFVNMATDDCVWLMFFDELPDRDASHMRAGVDDVDSCTVRRSMWNHDFYPCFVHISVAGGQLL